MARSWLIDSRGLAKKVINAGLPAAHLIKDCGANRRCPNCHYLIDNSDISQEWPGLPAGVKFDPSDVELLEHLAAKRGMAKSDPHVFVDEFIPTLEDKEGICCTHPENLPGAKKDGSSIHFFYRISNAYSSGRRKRRKIQDEASTAKSHVRWHKTGKTKAVMENGVGKGFKKIMVLYATPETGSKPEKCNWIMHQYHLGTDEDEEEGEYVVSKIFYQPEKAKAKANTSSALMDDGSKAAVQLIPMTPKTTTPDPPRHDKTPCSDYFIPEPSHGCWVGDDEYAISLEANSEALDFRRVESLLCNEIIESGVNADIARYGVGDLENLELTDFQDLQFGSQDSVFDLLDRL